MIIRHALPGDAEQAAAVFNAVACRLPGYQPQKNIDARPQTRMYAEEFGRVVAYAQFEPNGRVHYPWCLPGHEKMAHPLMASVFRVLGEQRVFRAYVACRADWTEPIEFFEDHGFDKVREIVNFTQSIGDLPTMFQRPGLDVSPLRSDDMREIEAMVPGLLRQHGKPLASHFATLPADSMFVLRKKNGSPHGVGLLIDDANFADVSKLDPRSPMYRLGAFGNEGLPTQRVNGLFSFVTAPGKDALLVGQDLLWYGTSRMESNTFETLAAQVPSDVPHLLAFYERYFSRQGSFPIFEREVGTGSRF